MILHFVTAFLLQEINASQEKSQRKSNSPSQTGKAPEGRIGLIFLDKVRSHGFLFSPLKNFSPFPPPNLPEHYSHLY